MTARPLIRIFGLPLVLAVACAGMVRATVMRVYEVPSASMRPTLEPGDVILATPVGGTISRGEIVVFRDDSTGQRFVKRVVAVPGDHISLLQGAVYLNGERLTEPYLLDGAGEGRFCEIIPAGHVWVLGDNRSASSDSRVLGPVAVRRIESRLKWVVYSRGA